MAAQSAKCDDIHRAFIQESRGKVSGFRISLIWCFSSLGLQMADRRHELYREAQFVRGVPVSALYPEVDSEETVLIRGIIDAYFEKKRGTDSVD